MLDEIERARFLRRSITVEEKVDGACIGLSFDDDGNLRVQKRGDYLRPDAGHQFAPLWPWLGTRRDQLHRALGTDRTLFGEWCYARHDVPYVSLPDYLIVIDVYEREAAKFVSTTRRDALAGRLGLSPAPIVARGEFDLSSLQAQLGTSRVGVAPMEGLYLRVEDELWLEARAKLVRPGWLQPDARNWSAKPVEPNLVRRGA